MLTDRERQLEVKIEIFCQEKKLETLNLSVITYVRQETSGHVRSVNVNLKIATSNQHVFLSYRPQVPSDSLDWLVLQVGHIWKQNVFNVWYVFLD